MVKHDHTCISLFVWCFPFQGRVGGNSTLFLEGSVGRQWATRRENCAKILRKECAKVEPRKQRRKQIDNSQTTSTPSRLCGCRRNWLSRWLPSKTIFFMTIAAEPHARTHRDPEAVFQTAARNFTIRLAEKLAKYLCSLMRRAETLATPETECLLYGTYWFRPIIYSTHDIDTLPSPFFELSSVSWCSLPDACFTPHSYFCFGSTAAQPGSWPFCTCVSVLGRCTRTQPGAPVSSKDCSHGWDVLFQSRWHPTGPLGGWVEAYSGFLAEPPDCDDAMHCRCGSETKTREICLPIAAAGWSWHNVLLTLHFATGFVSPST